MNGQFFDTKYIHIVVNLHNHPYQGLHLVKLNSVPMQIGYLCFLSAGKSQTTESLRVSVMLLCCCQTPGRVTGPSVPPLVPARAWASLGDVDVPQRPSDWFFCCRFVCCRENGDSQGSWPVSAQGFPAGREGPLPSSFLSTPSSGKTKTGGDSFCLNLREILSAVTWTPYSTHRKLSHVPLYPQQQVLAPAFVPFLFS